MRPLALLIAIPMFSPAWGQTSLDSASLYVNEPLKWERPQRPGQPTQKSAFGRILVMESEGSLATISCYLYKTPDNHLHIIYPEGFGMSSGTWKKADGHLAVRFRSIHSSAQKIGSENGYVEEKWGYTPSRAGDRVAESIKIAGVQYVPLRNFNDLKQLAEIIQFYRADAENPK